MNLKSKIIIKLLLSSATFLGIFGATEAVQAQNTKYSCTFSDGQLVTMAETPNGAVKLIEWSRIGSLLGGGENEAGKNCLEVSSRLQTHVEAGNNPIVSVGSLSRDNYFLCTANASGDCVGNNFGFLTMLKAGSDPNTALKQFFGFPAEYQENAGKIAIDLNRLAGDLHLAALSNPSSASSTNLSNTQPRAKLPPLPNKIPSVSSNSPQPIRNTRISSPQSLPPANTPNAASPKPLASNPTSSNRPKTNQYRCEDTRTVVHTRRGTIEMIVWKSDHFLDGGYSPERRCNLVAQRFQSFSDAKKLRYLSTGKINYQPVICVSDRSGKCMSNGLLLTLEPQDNPDEVLKDLFDLSARTSGGGIARADRDKTIVDFTRLLYTLDAK